MTLLADDLRASPVDLTVDLFFLRTTCMCRRDVAMLVSHAVLLARSRDKDRFCDGVVRHCTQNSFPSGSAIVTQYSPSFSIR